MNRALRFALWPALFIGHFLAVALLSWQLLAWADFAYPLGYRLLDLDEHIAEFAPLNRYKPDFGQVGEKDHWRLFHEITYGVQHNGEGLAAIRYSLADGRSIPLMHQAEIIHLQDVANLIHRFYLAGIAGAALWLILALIARRHKLTMPSARHSLLGVAAVLFTCVLTLLAIGPTRVFYWFHVQIFPEGHQWFFFYQDSLMTTLMKAPDIFAFIASLLLTVLIALWGLTFWWMTRWFTRDRYVATPLPNRKKSPRRRR